jgi:hypothetical protein
LDRAIWITWYNLPPEAKGECLSWLHSNYMPRVLARPDVLWGAYYASEEKVVPLGGGQGRVRHSAGDIPRATVTSCCSERRSRVRSPIPARAPSMPIFPKPTVACFDCARASA